MEGIRFYGHQVGIVGGLLTIVGMYGAAAGTIAAERKASTLQIQRSCHHQRPHPRHGIDNPLPSPLTDKIYPN
jgi:hypothetical protein